MYVFLFTEHHLHHQRKEMVGDGSYITLRKPLQVCVDSEVFAGHQCICYWQLGGRQRPTSSAETEWKWSRDYCSQHAQGLSACWVWG